MKSDPKEVFIPFNPKGFMEADVIVVRKGPETTPEQWRALGSAVLGLDDAEVRMHLAVPVRTVAEPERQSLSGQYLEFEGIKKLPVEGLSAIRISNLWGSLLRHFRAQNNPAYRAILRAEGQFVDYDCPIVFARHPEDFGGDLGSYGALDLESLREWIAELDAEFKEMSSENERTLHLRTHAPFAVGPKSLKLCRAILAYMDTPPSVE